MITSFYKHPVEMTVNSIIGSVLVYVLLGLSPVGGAIYTLFTALGEFFYHTNVRTPRWVGRVFQRPEMHRIHHEHRRRRNNYGDIVWWDMLFGTYENPPTWDARCGYDDGLEQRLGDMLLHRDVHAPPRGQERRARRAILPGADAISPTIAAILERLSRHRDPRAPTSPVRIPPRLPWNSPASSSSSPPPAAPANRPS